MTGLTVSVHRHSSGIPVWCTGRLLLWAAKETSKCWVKELWADRFQHLVGFALVLVMYTHLHPTKSNNRALEMAAQGFLQLQSSLHVHQSCWQDLREKGKLFRGTCEQSLAQCTAVLNDYRKAFQRQIATGNVFFHNSQVLRSCLENGFSSSTPAFTFLLTLCSRWRRNWL